MNDKEAEWAEFREVAAEQGMSDYTEALVRICVPSLRLRPARASKSKSRIGGKPDVPAGFEWPASSAGEPLTFVAQIDLAEVRATGLAGAEALPERGLLSFFHGYEPAPTEEHPGNAGRVFFFDEATPLAPVDGSALPRVPIAFDLQTEELPPLESPFYPLVLADAGELDEDPDESVFEVFRDFVDDEYGQVGLRDEGERPVHRLLGYADPLQADVYLCTEGNATRLPLDEWKTLEHYRRAARWRLLLQLDSDPKRDIHFGDGGVLAFMIREDDLAARRFDRVWVEWQSH